MSILFKDKSHTYTDLEGNIKFTSVTTFIKQFENFDKAYWSFYKAVERVLNEKNPEAFSQFKNMVGGYRNVNNHAKKLPRQTLEKIYKAQEDILMEWQAAADEACTVGSKYHLDREQEDIAAGTLVYNNVELPVISNGAKQIDDDVHIYSKDLSSLEAGVYLELLIFLKEIAITGLGDKVIIYEDKSFDIEDYKTNKEIKRTNQSKMKAPVDHLDDCNFYHYALQLSLYAYMLEQYGYKCKTLTLLHVVEGKIPVPYLKDEIIKMLKHTNKL